MYHTWLSASPATIDIVENLYANFDTLIVAQLCAESQDAVRRTENPAAMASAVRRRVRDDILNTLYGEPFFSPQFFNFVFWFFLMLFNILSLTQMIKMFWCVPVIEIKVFKKPPALQL
jgi:hypothetical protein